MFDDLISVIEEAGNRVDFASFGDGISDDWVELAEKRL